MDERPHTPTPFYVIETPPKSLHDQGHRCMAYVGPLMLAVSKCSDAARWTSVVKAERIASTLNACEGMADPQATITALVEALKAADVFIRNGIALGYIRMPDDDCPDPAKATPGIVRAALALVPPAGQGEP